MKVRPYRVCDVCRKEVSRKGLFFYRTEIPYVTLGMRYTPQHADDYEYKIKVHVCIDCWNNLATHIRDNIIQDE